MQLASPGVGYGVLESPVDSGNVYKHPFKRARTTGTYLAAATIGTDADRALIRDEVDRAHALVRSTPSSPVSYNAFDPRLQLWVAACLYRYYSTSTSSCTAHSTTTPPTRSTRTPRSWAPHCRSAKTCGRPTGPHSTSSGSARSTTFDRPAGARTPATALRRWRSCPAPLRLLAGPIQPVRDRGFPAARVPLADAAVVDRRSATQVRMVVDGAAARRPGDSPGRLDPRLRALSVGHAGPSAPRKASRLTACRSSLDCPARQRTVVSISTIVAFAHCRVDDHR